MSAAANYQPVRLRSGSAAERRARIQAGQEQPYTSDPELAEARRRIEVIERYDRARREARIKELREEWDKFWAEVKKSVLTPILVPFRLIRQAATSPLTISLVLKLILMGFLLLASSVISLLAVGAFFWSWSIGGPVEVEGWLFYGSKTHRPPHVTVPLPLEKILTDLRYDVQVELELVRPTRGTSEEIGNFMLSLEMRSLQEPGTVLVSAAQPSLPPPPLPAPLLSLPVLPTSYLPCVLPWPFRSFCPSRLLGYAPAPNSKIRERRLKGGYSSPSRGKDVVPLRKDLMEGVLIKPGRVPEATIGSVFISIGREDLFEDKEQNNDSQCKPPSREVKTTGWVVIRLVPRPTGIRWILSFHPIPPLLLLPPISLALTFSSSIIAFAIISIVRRPKSSDNNNSNRSAIDSPAEPSQPHERIKSERELRIEAETRAFEARDRQEKRDAQSRREEWDEMQSSNSGGLRRFDSQGSAIAAGISGAGRGKDATPRSSTVGGSETTASSSAIDTSRLTVSTNPSSSASSSSDSSARSNSDSTVTPTRLRSRGGSASG
ncbi:hypothetical protein I317_05842 [Kwoniella heveanensis CBS 569]|nr:hypothetical protein I317_05842 [Kwoniella heveanensis CBS 569]